MFLSPAWRASPGKLRRLFIHFARRVIPKKPLELLTGNHARASRYTGVIFKELVALLKRVERFRLQLARRIEE